ncbi:MAG: hypothetical protein ABIA37_03270, partial [Candidatus Woesearchaeota archaeon]
VFSSLTNKEKVDELIHQKMLEAEELERKNLPFFEELYIYVIRKSALLRELESKGVSGVSYFAHGKRGDVFTGIFNSAYSVKKYLAKLGKIKVAIKVKRKESFAVDRIRNEVEWLKLLNQEGIGPQLLFSGENFMVYQFIEGEFILDFMSKNKENKKKVNNVLIDVLKQCLKMDQLGVNKEEMHHPYKHIITTTDSLGDKPILIDFERCYSTDNPHNVTQFGDFLLGSGLVDKEKMIKLLREYKKERIIENYNKIVNLITHS